MTVPAAGATIAVRRLKDPSTGADADVIEFCADRLPRWNFINVCGYHVREAGGTLVHEVAFALADAITYAKQNLGVTHMVDAATLTGAIVVTHRAQPSEAAANSSRPAEQTAPGANRRDR